MKRVRCPKCENFLTFDETKYTEGQSLVFICDHCKSSSASDWAKAKYRRREKKKNWTRKNFKTPLAASL